MKFWKHAGKAQAKRVAKGLALLACLSAGIAGVALGLSRRHTPRGAGTADARQRPDTAFAVQRMRDPLFASQTYLASALRRLQDPAPDTEEAIAAIHASLQCLKRLEAMDPAFAE